MDRGLTVSVSKDRLALSVVVDGETGFEIQFNLEQSTSLLELIQAGVELLREREAEEPGEPYQETMRRQLRRERGEETN